jgi:hypothetical protein
MRYCPDCRAEYAPGTERCHDCEVDLVDVLVDDTSDESPPPEKLVTIAAFDTPVKASILASRLEAEGIECFLADAETIAVHALLSAAIGGVKVQVREPDAMRAAAIVRQVAPTAIAGQPPSAVCPRCGSADVRRKGMSLLVAIIAVVTLGILALFFTPAWKCPQCSHEWK